MVSKCWTNWPELTYADKRYAEAAVAYRKLYDAAPTATERYERP